MVLYLGQFPLWNCLYRVQGILDRSCVLGICHVIAYPPRLVLRQLWSWVRDTAVYGVAPPPKLAGRFNLCPCLMRKRLQPRVLRSHATLCPFYKPGKRDLR
jgi:hypothetical protein